MVIDIITPFPNLVEGVFSESMLNQAQKKGLVQIDIWNLRSFTNDHYQSVDDAPYGGGAGMILKPEPIFLANDAIVRKRGTEGSRRTIFMTPQGRQFDQDLAWELSREEHLVFICGHYRGIDERIIDSLVTDEISIGDYILTGGELTSAVVIDALVRLIPGVLGNFDSAEGDSFSGHLLDHPHYTRPEEFRGMKVPEILLSGHHAAIDKWREQMAIQKTKERRPDLWNKYEKENFK